MAVALPLTARGRPILVYALVVLVGVVGFLYPFWLPSSASPARAHSADAPLLAGIVGALVVAAVTLELQRGTMRGATVALLGMLSASLGLLRLLDLPGGGNAMFFLLVLAGAGFGPRFGMLLGLCGMATSAVLTGGIGPWLPFQMLTLAWMGGGAGVVGRVVARRPPWVEIGSLAVYGWVWGFVYGGVMNLQFWPLVRDGGPLSWAPGLGLDGTLERYWAFYVATSLAWDAAGAFVNAALIVVTGRAVLRGMRRVAHRLEPVVDLA